VAAIDEQIKEIVEEIRSVADAFRLRSSSLQKHWSDESLTDSAEVADQAWRAVFLSYACTRISSLVENESLVGSSLGALAVARYILELHILVKHLIGGRLYGLVCARLLYQDRLNHERALLDQHLCEIEVYEKFQLVESSKIERGSIGTAEDMAKLDQEARQSFCFYLEKAKYSGYGYWADRMKREMLPSIQSQIELLERKLGEFENRYPFFSEPNPLPKEIRWQKAADVAALKREWDFIYKSTSRLLHSLPGSLVVEQQEQTAAEVRMYLDFTCVTLTKIGEAIDLFIVEVPGQIN
jgi:hypothetical protein